MSREWCQRCEGCDRTFRLEWLDTPLADVEGADATQRFYCRDCFPSFVIVEGDRWREGVAP